MVEVKSQFKIHWSQHKKGRVLVVGDIHGEFQMFQRLLKLAQYNERDDFVFALGDLIDRGPHSREVLDWFAREYGCASLLGNHEALMLGAAGSWDLGRTWKHNGGGWADDLGPTAAYLYRGMLRQMHVTGEIEYAPGHRIGLVHAEVLPGMSWSRMKNLCITPEDVASGDYPTPSAGAIWGRSRFIADALLREMDVSTLSADRKVSTWKNAQPVKGIDVVICGHTMTPDCLPRGRGNVLWIDTGASYADGDYQGRLTAVDPLTRTYWQAGRGNDETWGPLPWPEFEPVPAAMRPTRKDIDEAKKMQVRADEKQKDMLRLFGFG